VPLSDRSRRTFLVFYCVLVGVLILGVLEVASAIILGGRSEASLSIFDDILQNDKDVFEITPFYDEKWTRSEFDVSIRTNSRGFREDFEFEDSSVDIAFMGDSFTFGFGVDVKDRYTNVVARQHPNETVVSLSYNNGLQPEHYEYFLGRHTELAPRILFVGLYLGNDLDNDLNETLIERDMEGNIARLQLPYRDVYRGTLINKPNFKYDWLSSFVDTTSLGKLLAIKINSSHSLRGMFKKDGAVLPDAANSLSTELGNLDEHRYRVITALKNIEHLMASRNGEFHILVIPQNFLVGDVQFSHVAPDNQQRIDEIKAKSGLLKTLLNLCDSESLNCHDLSTILTKNDYFERDLHWNQQGHDKVGRYVSEVIAGVAGK
jgi:hypothetical protein